MVATADAYMAIRPGIRIAWEKRSLQDFADYPIERLAEIFDLLVIDHPFVGYAAAHDVLVPLDMHLSMDQLAEQARESVGQSNASYQYGGHQWALAIDAAAQVSVYREDLLQRYGLTLPRTWDEVLALAAELRGKTQAWVGMPLIPIDTLMCFCTLCANAGEAPFLDEGRLVSRAAGRHVLELLRQLRDACHPESLTWNPPRALDRMSASDEVAYCPLLFGYSNYSRPGFRPKVLHFAGIPSARAGEQHGAILGGTGLAVSQRCGQKDVAADYCAYVAGAPVQRGLYFDSGGQPGHRAAWTDPRVNAACHDFFRNTLDTLDRAYLRPRFDGYMGIQGRAADLLHRCLREGGAIDDTLAALDTIYSRGLAEAGNLNGP
jgi:multiple sugar transport system substrate-binding protein